MILFLFVVFYEFYIFRYKTKSPYKEYRKMSQYCVLLYYGDNISNE